MFWYVKLLVLIKIVNLLKINVLKILIWVWIMSWLEYYGLIDIGNDLFSWFGKILSKDDFELCFV